MTELSEALIDLAVNVGVDAKGKGGCLIGLILLVCGVLFAFGCFYIVDSSCKTRCTKFGTATLIEDRCMCRTTIGTYIDPNNPPGAIPR